MMLLQRLSLVTSLSKSQQHRAWVLLGMVGTTPVVALCEKKDKNLADTLFVKDKDGNIQWSQSVSQVSQSAFWDEIAQVTGNKVQGAVDSGIPTQLSYGFLSGYCSGYALKKVGRTAATIFGLGFMTMQTLAYKGYLNVDHVKIRKDIEGIMDLNDDGSVDAKDRAIATKKIMEVLQFNMPAGSGFAAGFIGGLRSG